MAGLDEVGLCWGFYVVTEGRRVGWRSSTPSLDRRLGVQDRVSWSVFLVRWCGLLLDGAPGTGHRQRRGEDLALGRGVADLSRATDGPRRVVTRSMSCTVNTNRLRKKLLLGV